MIGKRLSTVASANSEEELAFTQGILFDGKPVGIATGISSIEQRQHFFVLSQRGDHVHLFMR